MSNDLAFMRMPVICKPTKKQKINTTHMTRTIHMIAKLCQKWCMHMAYVVGVFFPSKCSVQSAICRAPSIPNSLLKNETIDREKKRARTIPMHWNMQMVLALLLLPLLSPSPLLKHFFHHIKMI